MTKNVAVIDVQLGDCAKGKVANHFSPDYDFVCRFSGSGNSGHIIYMNGKKYTHHLVPCVDWREPKTRAFLGADMVISPKELCEEIFLIQNDFPEIAKRIIVDPDAFVVSSKHIEEDKKNGTTTTNKGVGPAYMDKMSRKGIKIRDVLINSELEGHNYLKELIKAGVQFKYVLEMYDEFKNSSILFEGAQSLLLDISHGIYPVVSCGNSGLGGIIASGFSFVKFDHIYGVMKPYLTKAGAPGPLPTEMSEKDAAEIREVGKEMGATTNRPRRIGWLDLPALRYAIRKGNITDLIISKFDVLDGRKEVIVCNEYEKEPMSGGDFFNAKPKYISMPGWEKSEYPTLNANIRNFVAMIEKATNTPVRYISNGVETKNFHEFVK
jgi:adenylosuccinate synthase